MTVRRRSEKEISDAVTAKLLGTLEAGMRVRVLGERTYFGVAGKEGVLVARVDFSRLWYVRLDAGNAVRIAPDMLQRV